MLFSYVRSFIRNLPRFAYVRATQMNASDDDDDHAVLQPGIGLDLYGNQMDMTGQCGLGHVVSDDDDVCAIDTGTCNPDEYNLVLRPLAPNEQPTVFGVAAQRTSFGAAASSDEEDAAAVAFPAEALTTTKGVDNVTRGGRSAPGMPTAATHGGECGRTGQGGMTGTAQGDDEW